MLSPSCSWGRSPGWTLEFEASDENGSGLRIGFVERALLSQEVHALSELQGALFSA